MKPLKSRGKIIKINLLEKKQLDVRDSLKLLSEVLSDDVRVFNRHGVDKDERYCN